MKESDKRQFFEAIKSLESVYGAKIEAPAIYWRLLQPFDIGAVVAAFDAHMLASKWLPKPSEIIEKLTTQVKRMGADEAWGVALAAADENQTVVWTDEIAEAWFSASPIWETGDEIGARMAFRDAYKRITTDQLRRPQVIVSMGHNAEMRALAIENAVSRGLLSHDHPAVKMLPAPEGANSVAQIMSGRAPVLQIGKQKSDKSPAQLFREAVEAGAGKLRTDQDRRKLEAAEKIADAEIEAESRKPLPIPEIKKQGA